MTFLSDNRDPETGGGPDPAAAPPGSRPVAISPATPAAGPEADQLFDMAEIDLIPRPPLDPDAREAA